MDSRPSHKELSSKLRIALECLNEAGMPRVLIDRQTVRAQISTNLERLRLDSLAEYWRLVIRCLTAASKDPIACYTGRKPPDICTNVKTLKNLEMFAFSVDDPTLKKSIYTKFAIKKMPQGTLWYGHITCHEDEKR